MRGHDEHQEGMLYSVGSGRLLMEQMGYNLLFRRFVGLNVAEVWEVTVFTPVQPCPPKDHLHDNF